MFDDERLEYVAERGVALLVAMHRPQQFDISEYAAEMEESSVVH